MPPEHGQDAPRLHTHDMAYGKYDKRLGAYRDSDGISAGDALPSNLIFDSGGFFLTDSAGIRWRVTVDTTGHLVTTLSTGSPYGLLLALTQP